MPSRFFPTESPKVKFTESVTTLSLSCTAGPADHNVKNLDIVRQSLEDDEQFKNLFQELGVFGQPFQVGRTVSSNSPAGERWSLCKGSGVRGLGIDFR